MVYISVSYTADVGSFFVSDGHNFPTPRGSAQPDLRIPLVRNTLIGLATPEEQHLCTGGIVSSIYIPEMHREFYVSFSGRPVYDNGKIIIPADHGSVRIDFEHGMLRFDDNGVLYYMHKGTQQTTLWTSNKGILRTITGQGELVPLDLSERVLYLLLGGIREEEDIKKLLLERVPGMTELGSRFSPWSYYVRLST